ncbi:MAG: prephenate dehydratase [Chryseobacterium sp. 39-10]|nr:prephenate dehydratase [Chryseobacterium sp.]OJV46026.1 MAG: prephenate dehydratase [Chryseobacterium sp. 39-10]
MKIAYLGPEASFTQLTASQIFPNEELLSQSSILDCFNAVEKGEVQKAVVPLENSIEGTVSMTLDYLYDFDVFIENEVVMPIAHHLMIHPHNDDFEKIISHPQALAQTFHFRYRHYKDVPSQDFSSTAASAKLVSENAQEKWAAVANHFAAQLYGLKIVHENIQDFEQNHTKFIVISKRMHGATELKHDVVSEKSSLIVTLPDDHAGGLHQVLSVFAWRKMNLSKIESRTLKTGLGNYFFFINVANEWHPVLAKNVFEELQSLNINVKFLGHYKEYLIKE